MANYFDRFDQPDTTASPSGNYFDQFDEAASPIQKAMAAHEEDVLQYQAARQQEWMDRQKAIREFEAANPQARVGPDIMREEVPDVDPYLKWRDPPIAAREEAPKQKLGSGFAASLKMDLLGDPATKRRVLAATLFPDDPGGIYRVGFDADGTPVYVGDDGKLHKIASGTARFGANLIANSPETIFGTLGSVYGGPATGAYFAAGAHAAKRRMAGAYFGEPYDPEAIARGATIEALTNVGGDVVGRGIGVAANRGRQVDFTPENMAKAEIVRDRVKQSTGVDLDLAQASGDRRLIALRAYVARYPGPSANLVQAAEERARGQFHEATERVLNTITQASPAEVAGQNGISAAQLAIDTARRAAEARVDPLYRAAYEKVPAVMDPTVIRFFRHPEFRDAYRQGQEIARLEEKELPESVIRTTRYVKEPAVKPEAPPMSVSEVPEMKVTPLREPPVPPPGLTADQGRLTFQPEPKPPGTDLVPARAPPRQEVGFVIDKEGNIVPHQRTFKRERMPAGYYRTREVVDEGVMKIPDLRGLDYTKRGLDQMIESLKKSGHRQEARALAWQRKRFVQALDSLDVPEYKAARAAWAQEMENNINPLEKGIIGVLARTKDVHASKAAARLFSDPNLTPTMVEQAKRAIKKDSPEDWHALTRSWIAYKFNQAQRVPMTSTDVNTPGRFHQMLFGTPTARANTLAMLDRESAEALEGVMEAAEALKRTPTAGSNTFRDQETQRIFEGLTGTGFRTMDAVLNPRRTLREWGQRVAAERATMAVAEGILDPKKRHQLRVILRMRPSTRRNILLINVLGAHAGKGSVESGMSEGENTKLVAGEEGALGQ